MKKKRKQSRIILNNPDLMSKDKRAGITLIALVITIIVLLILAGVSIALLTGDNGILTKANNASEQTKQSGAVEKVKLAVGESYDNLGKFDYEAFKTNVAKVEGFEKFDGDNVIVDGTTISVDKTSGKVTLVKSGESTGDDVWTGTVNKPKMTSDMTAIYWDESKAEQTTTADNSNWYNYDEKKWANAKTSDGSYLVWIPRYEYKILTGEGLSTTGTIDVKFISTTTTTPDEGYKIHPAFQDGTANKYANGEWKTELDGIWIAKYEMSMETNGAFTETSSTAIGNVATSATIKAVSKPGVTSWRNIYTGTSYTNSYNYDRNKESHQMKNSEWGATAYLSKSKYGQEGTEVQINSNSSYYTGGGSGEACG